MKAGRILIASVVAGLVGALAGPVGALGQDPPPPPPPPCEQEPPVATPDAPCLTLKLEKMKNGVVKPLKGGRILILRRAVIHGTLNHGQPTPYAPNQSVEVTVHRGDNPDPYIQRTVPVTEVDGQTYGTYQTDFKVEKTGPYHVTVNHAANPGPPDPAIGEVSTGPKTFKVRYPSLRFGSNGTHVRFYQAKMRGLGYLNMPGNGHYGSGMGRAVLAIRKVNRWSRAQSPVTSSMYKAAVGNRGRMGVAHPGAGRHVEVSLKRQVMALIEGGKTKYVFHVSTGAPGMSTIRGKFHFYRKDPGYNSHSMYYSVYFRGGYATHGYNPVPTYPASHGCVRNPIPNSRFIYNWTRLGMPIFVYW